MHQPSPFDPSSILVSLGLRAAALGQPPKRDGAA